MDVDTFFSHIRGEFISLIDRELIDLNSARMQMTTWIRFIQEFDNVVEIDRVDSGSFVVFHDGQNQAKVPFTMYANFEAIL